MKKIFIVLVVAGFILEALVLTGIYDTKGKVSSGGDIFHNKVENLPLQVGGGTRILAKGTYVVTREGPLLLPWYWVYQFWYVTAILPLLMMVAAVVLYFRGGGKPSAEVAERRT